MALANTYAELPRRTSEGVPPPLWDALEQKQTPPGHQCEIHVSLCGIGRSKCRDLLRRPESCLRGRPLRGAKRGVKRRAEAGRVGALLVEQHLQAREQPVQRRRDAIDVGRLSDVHDRPWKQGLHPYS